MQKHHKKIFIFTIVILLFSGTANLSAAKSKKPILVTPIFNDHHRYCLEVLKLALSYSEHDYAIDYIEDSSSQTRELQRLLDGKVDVTWMATSEKYESQALPIRIPLYRGLLGYRIFIIRKGEQSRFDNINSVEDLKSISLGQGTDWADTLILEANNLKVIKTRKYENLFYMLEGGRFDAFPRGVHEPWQELESHLDFKFAVEKSLVLVYRMPMYFFVSKDNAILGREIERGLMKAIEDGSFNKLFFGNQMIRDVLTKANLEQRKVFHLDNPVLPPNTPVNDDRLWWSPTNPTSPTDER